MHVFVTGATGWVGSAVVDELLATGHTVTGLARTSDKGAELRKKGASVLRASLEDSDALQAAAADSDAVIHTAFNHDFSRFIENCEQDRQVIGVLGEALLGSTKPLLVTSGLSGLPAGATETDLPNAASPRKSEAAARSLAEQGVRAATVRLAPSVHGLGDHGFIPILVRLAREQGVSAYVGDGDNCWSGVYRRDAAAVYRLALENGVTEAVYHAVACESVSFKERAEAIGRQLHLPVESRERAHFGWFANMAAGNMAVSSARTREVLGWKPSGPSLLADIDRPAYYAR
jgi:nucleoside-diphosphate-sugar epimerase